jgi:hypothetical protein
MTKIRYYYSNERTWVNMFSKGLNYPSVTLSIKLRGWIKGTVIPPSYDILSFQTLGQV